MSWDHRPDAKYKARNAVKQFTSRGIELDASITAAVAELDRIEAEVPRQAEPNTIRDAIVNGADSDAINALVLAELGFTRLRSAYMQAVQVAGGRALKAFHIERDNLHAALKVLAEHAITHLEKVAALDGATLEELVRAGRHDDAQALAEVEVVGTELAALYTIRDDYLTPGGLRAARVGDVDCTQWRDPQIAGRYARVDRSVAANFVAVLRNGGELWFPTAEEAVEAAGPIHAEAKAAAAHAAEIRNRTVGSTVSFN
ncbi:Uncharacterised protein [Mycobacteroides abscessus subsp. abscessus]|uniref:hypothetical protein n=1 Tax=Mycobacteroides abscessus TaxID=36809 RepID=UPI000928ED0D|nr:hypothetical protein [Mycobacteroides abscessus]SIA00067.1 Uncharacterised protein [Mycobacteroides abscessus subsp. abscessus]SIA00166.1 Uncharacterised protein [Mycobacteroides abscessus subsp. abscessus]